MKRHWRVSRIIPAALLLSLAGLAVYYWPVQPRWKMPAEQLVGFDMQRGLLYTANVDQKNKPFELHGFDLDTGYCKINMPIELVKPELRTSCTFVTSLDGSTVVCCDTESVCLVLDVHHQRHNIFKTDVFQHIDSFSVSANGELLALRLWGQVLIWNRLTEKIHSELTMPEDAVVNFRSGVWLCEPERMQFSADGHYLAVTGIPIR